MSRKIPIDDDLDERIRRAVERAIAGEREWSRRMLVEIVSEMQNRFNAKLDPAIDQISKLRNELRALDGGKTDSVIYKEWIGPQSRN